MPNNNLQQWNKRHTACSSGRAFVKNFANLITGFFNGSTQMLNQREKQSTRRWTQGVKTVLLRPILWQAEFSYSLKSLGITVLVLLNDAYMHINIFSKEYAFKGRNSIMGLKTKPFFKTLYKTSINFNACWRYSRVGVLQLELFCGIIGLKGKEPNDFSS